MVISTSVRRVETNTGLHKINRIPDESPATLYCHLECNVMLELTLMLRVTSHFLGILNLVFRYVRDVHREENVYVID